MRTVGLDGDSGGADLAPDTLLDGRYRVLRRLAVGGMSTVYEVSDARLPGRWVLKALRVPEDGERARELAEQFRREAEVLARLSHPRLPRVVDFFLARETLCLVMERVEGQTLAEAVGPAPVGEARVADWGVQLCELLEVLHEQGIVYRDLKPSNVMLGPDGALRLIDFGIARTFAEGKPRDTTVMGTPGFAAPEQYGHRQTDPRSDLYSLGVLLHHLLTGHAPEATPFALPPVRSLNPLVSERMEQVVARATDPDPERRFGSCREMAGALRGQPTLGAGGERFGWSGAPPRLGSTLGVGALWAGVMALGAASLETAPFSACLGLLLGPAWLALLARDWRLRRRAAVELTSHGLAVGDRRLDWGAVREVRFAARALDGAEEALLSGDDGTVLALPLADPRPPLDRVLDEPRLPGADRLVRLVLESARLVPERPGSARYLRDRPGRRL